METNEKIYQLRRALDLTQEALAKEVNVSAKTVMRWEAGEREPSGETLRALATALETSVAFLMGETDDPRRPQIQNDDIKSEETSDDEDRVEQITVLLRRVVKDKDHLPKADKELLNNILKYGIKALEDDPEAKKVDY